MRNRFWLLALVFSAAFWFSLAPAWAVYSSVNGYVTTDTGYTTSAAIAIEDYVGTINGASGVYVGNGWVLSVAHLGVSAGDTYTLDGVTYTVASVVSIGTGTDLVMFSLVSTTTAQATLLSTLGSLTIATSAPTVNSKVALVGYGDSDGYGGTTTLTTGTSWVYAVNESVQLSPYTTTDFEARGNNTYVTGGDSGGGAFVKVGNSWVLTGVLEAQLSSNGTPVGSAAIELSAYATEIASVMAVTPVPEPGVGLLWGMGCVGLLPLIGSRLARGRRLVVIR